MSRMTFLLGTLFFFPVLLFTQESFGLLENNYFFPDGYEYYDNELYGLSLAAFEELHVSDNNIRKAALNSFKLDETRSIDLLLESIARSYDPKFNNDVYNAIGNKYFEKKELKESKEIFHQSGSIFSK